MVRMLSQLDPKQLRTFREYLSCDFFNTNATLLRLLDLLLEKVVKGDGNGSENEDVLEGSGINPGLLDKLCSKLLHHLNGFIVQLAREEDPGADFALTLGTWNRMGLPSELLEREYSKMKRKLASKSASEFGMVYTLQMEHIYAQVRAKQPRNDQVAIFDQLHESLDSFYVVQKLKYLCASLSVDRIFRQKGKGVTDSINLGEWPDLPPLGQVYQISYNLLVAARAEVSEAEKLYEMLEEEGNNFAHEDRRDLFGYLLNGCIRSMSAGDFDARGLINKVYDALLKHGLLISNGQISGGHFKNIVSTRVRSGRIEEASQFIDDCGELLPAAEKDVLIAYTRGLVAFHSDQFREAISLFRAIVTNNPEDMFWSLEARNMLWKSYFEEVEELSIEEHEEMLRLYDSFRQFVSRNGRISDYHKEGYENFIRIFNRLIKIDEKESWADSKPKLLALHEEASAVFPLPNKDWLLAAILRKIEN